MNLYNPPSQPSPETQNALNAYLVSADELNRQGKLVEAELRLTEALALARKKFGPHSDQSVLVLSIMAAFYRKKGKPIEASQLEDRIMNWSPDEALQPCEEPLPEPPGPLTAKMIQRKATAAQSTAEVKSQAKQLPHNVRKYCQILGLKADANLTPPDVHKAWKQQLLNQNAHPDLGGNTLEAVLLNEAKARLLDYLEFVKPRSSSRWKQGGNSQASSC